MTAKDFILRLSERVDALIFVPFIKRQWTWVIPENTFNSHKKELLDFPMVNWVVPDREMCISIGKFQFNVINENFLD